MRLSRRQLENQLRIETIAANWYSDQYFKLMYRLHPGGPVPGIPSELFKTGYQARLSTDLYKEAMTENGAING